MKVRQLILKNHFHFGSTQSFINFLLIYLFKFMCVCMCMCVFVCVCIKCGIMFKIRYQEKVFSSISIIVHYLHIQQILLSFLLSYSHYYCFQPYVLLVSSVFILFISISITIIIYIKHIYIYIIIYIIYLYVYIIDLFYYFPIFTLSATSTLTLH